MTVPCHALLLRKIGNPQKAQQTVTDIPIQAMPTSTKLSVNINKIALIRNSRGGNMPDLLRVARDCEAFGADGITVHPRPDQRHIRYEDVGALKEMVTTELNVEGNPTKEFMDLVLRYRPHQCTLVPDHPSALTSDSGWDTVGEKAFLTEVIQELRQHGIRVSVFVDPVPEMVIGAHEAGADRIEFYTGPYAARFPVDPVAAISAHRTAARKANELGMGINAGHDLNLLNLRYYALHIPQLLEVSIGHALVCDALYYGLSNVVGMYKYQLRPEPGA